MTANLYSYLRSELQAAISSSFPDLSVSAGSIPLFFKSPSLSADLSTPVACRIASLKRLSADAVASQILSFFKWNEKFIISDPDHYQTVTNGFICFRTSLSFQYDALKNAASESEKTVDAVCNHQFLIEAANLLQQTIPLLRHAEILIPSTGIFKQLHFDLLDMPTEHKLIRLIAVSHAEELYSSGAAAYFLQQLIGSLNSYMAVAPVFSNNELLTFSRVTLIRACHNRIISLLNFYSKCSAVN